MQAQDLDSVALCIYFRPNGKAYRQSDILIDTLLSHVQTEEATPDVPLPGLKQKGKEANAIGKAPAQSGPGAADQVSHSYFKMLLSG